MTKAPRRKTGRCGWARRLLCGAAAAVLGFLAGCTPDSQVPNDPLVGGPPIPRGGAAVADTTRPAGRTVVPPVPAPSSSGSTAALASGSGVRTLDPGRELKIDSGTVPASGATWQGREAPGPVVLQPPQPVTGEGKAPPATPAGSGSTYEKLKADLLARGVLWMRLDSSAETGEVKFTCSLASRQNPNVRRTYEARARDEVSALRAVLDKIDSEK